MKQFVTDNHFQMIDGKRIRVGPILKTEFSSAMGLTHKYVWCELIRNNDEVMKHIIDMGYQKHSRFISRKVAVYLAHYYDVYLEGISDDVASDV